MVSEFFSSFLKFLKVCLSRPQNKDKLKLKEKALVVFVKHALSLKSETLKMSEDRVWKTWLKTQTRPYYLNKIGVSQRLP
jgi:hypothetical protein